MAEIEREAMEYDVVIIGAGPAGLSAAIRIKQKAGDDVSVVVLEKGSEVGAHILSGAILDVSGLNELIPDWQEKDAPIKTAVGTDHFHVFSDNSKKTIPHAFMPPLLSNKGCYIVSMGNVCRWMAEQAEAIGVEVFPGFAASELVYGENGELAGVVAGEFGLNPDGTPGPNYEPGMELRGKYVFFSEGARGSLSQQLIEKFDLAKDADHQKYGLGMKEIWEIDPAKHKLGHVEHSMGWPLDKDAGGGSFIYHLEDNQVYVGFVVHLDYKNPHLFPYGEFQKFKHHPHVAELLKGGRRTAYGARVISGGGVQSLPKMVFPGGALLGCAAGTLNFARLKGNHNAMLSGIAAADAVIEALADGRAGDELTAYETEVRTGPIYKDIDKVRNVKSLGKKGTLGVMLSGMDMWWASLFGKPLFGTQSHGVSDAEATGKAADYPKLTYPKPDGELSFDRLTNVSFSFTNHAEEQPCHLKLKDPSVPIEKTLPEYDEPSQRYCPAGVYEVVEQKGDDGPKFVINAQNCVHCKTCDIKDPARNIVWTTPQGGEGPNYPNM
ncbi:electron transfer flavoprotein-ubiquinone oxidoreductase [Maritalea myrionectae]|uniref:electron transfer flavoprotein-ubiquinone oxidoreductase n=1 Tax=Maritalea myrionectae TaxID=454601 RepID=UPI0003F87BF0|nr:electron transfer flavoprotein-ubiquinone oxidoreductase [Maritalea myrionectae]